MKLKTLALSAIVALIVSSPAWSRPMPGPTSYGVHKAQQHPKTFAPAHAGGTAKAA